MITVGDVLEFLETLAPRYMKMDWDHVGLLCGRSGREVRRILVALDPFQDVCQEAADWGAELLVTHHPLIFQPPQSITDDTSVGRCILFLAARDMAAINAHTNLDCAPGGVNDCLAGALGLEETVVLNPSGTDGQGRPWGLLRAGRREPVSLEAFLEQVKQRLGCPGLRYVSGGRPVCRVAVGGGACGDGVREAFDAGCDTFVTADVKYNQFWDARDLVMNLIDAGHFWTENPVCATLAEKLQGQFPQILVKVSEHHTDCIKFC